MRSSQKEHARGERITGAVVELFALAAVISKLQLLIDRKAAGNGHGPSRDMIVGKSFCRHAAVRIREKLHGLFANTDESILRTADAMLSDLSVAGLTEAGYRSAASPLSGVPGRIQ